MEGRTTVKARRRDDAGGSRACRVLLVPVAASMVALSAARAEAQQASTPPGLPPEADRTVVAESHPDIVRVPGGWTADAAGARARTTSFDVAAKEASLRAAEAHVAAAVVALFPRLSGLGSYTRYQDLAQPSLGTLVEPSNPGPVGRLPAMTPLSAVPLAFTIPLNYWLVQATITVPLSDYVLRPSQEHGAAMRRADAARFDKLASEAQAYSDAKLAFYQYVKAVAQHDVLVQSKAAADGHLEDAQNLFRAGRGSNADRLAADANVAAAQLAVDQATEMAGVAEEQLRLATHAPPSEPVSIGEDVTSAILHDTFDIAALKQEAATNRPEIQSLLRNAEAQQRLATSARAAQWPSVSAFGDYLYANPSPRIFVPEQQFAGYWDAGVRVTWAMNEVFSAAAAGDEQQAHATALLAQSAQVRDAIFMEVTQAVLAMRTADSSIESSAAQRQAAEEAYRARRELFRVGKGTSVELADTEANLFRARLAAVSARLDQRIARVHIEHATGRAVARGGS
jgi:outer membrane protein